MSSMAIIALITTAISTAYGIASSVISANAQAQMQEAQAKSQADSLRQQAEQENQNQIQESLIARRENARKVASAETSYAASGVTLQGTPTLSLTQMSEELELDVIMAESASNQKRQLLLTDAYNTELFGYANASLTSTSGILSAVGTGLSGAASIGSTYAYSKKES